MLVFAFNFTYFTKFTGNLLTKFFLKYSNPASPERVFKKKFKFQSVLDPKKIAGYLSRIHSVPSSDAVQYRAAFLLSNYSAYTKMNCPLTIVFCKILMLLKVLWHLASERKSEQIPKAYEN